MVIKRGFVGNRRLHHHGVPLFLLEKITLLKHSSKPSDTELGITRIKGKSRAKLFQTWGMAWAETSFIMVRKSMDNGKGWTSRGTWIRSSMRGDFFDHLLSKKSKNPCGFSHSVVLTLLPFPEKRVPLLLFEKYLMASFLTKKEFSNCLTNFFRSIGIQQCVILAARSRYTAACTDPFDLWKKNQNNIFLTNSWMSRQLSDLVWHNPFLFDRQDIEKCVKESREFNLIWYVIAMCRAGVLQIAQCENDAPSYSGF